MWVAITVAVIALIFTIVCLIIVLPSTNKLAASSSNGGYSDNIPDVSGIGVCYGADRPSHNDMVADFQKIKDAGFSIIRTYFPAFYDIPVTDAAAEVGIKVLLGWPWKDPEFHLGLDLLSNFQIKKATKIIRPAYMTAKTWLTT